MEIRTKINIVNDRGEAYMGPGVVQLLERIRECKSIRQAAKSMELSYVKALKLLNRLERDLGRKILIRMRGGCNRGGARITSFGEQFINEYKRLENKVSMRAETEFRDFCLRLERNMRDE